MRIPTFVREYVPLASHTTFGIGGAARWFAEPSTRDEVSEAFRFARAVHAPLKVLGGGSNILVSDAGVDAVVLRLSPSGEFGRMEQDASDPLVWRAGAAVPLQALVGETARLGVAGLEGLAGIPGAVGGAVCMNCGSAADGIGRFVEWAEVCRADGECVRMERDALSFGYRTSALRGLAAMSVSFRFAGRDEPDAILGRMRERREAKKAGQPLAVPSCGCIFKNPAGASAGMLIDAAGCGGMREGGAEVSGIHANFIVNRNKATCRDVCVLANAVREKVRSAHGVLLEPEVVYWGVAEDLGCCRGSMHVDNR